MALDYNKLSDEELEAIANNEYDKLSDATLQAIASDGGSVGTAAPKAPPYQPTALDYAGAVPKTAMDLAMQYPKTTGVAADLALAALPKSLESAPVLGKAIQAAKYPYRLGQAGLEALQRIGQGPVAPGAVPTPPTGPSPILNAQGQPFVNTPPAAQQPPTANNFIQRMSQLAQRYAPTARTVGAVAVPSAVAGAGAALSNQAANQVQAMTPEQRRQLYSSSMMGAMSGDAGFASAIMNAGQQ